MQQWRGCFHGAERTLNREVDTAELSTFQTKDSCCCLISSYFLRYFASCTPDLISPMDSSLFRDAAALSRHASPTLGLYSSRTHSSITFLAVEKNYLCFLGYFFIAPPFETGPLVLQQSAIILPRLDVPPYQAVLYLVNLTDE